MSKIHILSLEEVEHITFTLAREILSFNEPIPDFGTRYPNRLEACLESPRQSYDGELYPTLIEKAAILFYLMIKDHPFKNGNKRIAMTTLILFLYRNKKWIKVNSHEFYRFTMWIAESPAKAKEGTLHAIRDFLKQNMISEK